MVQKPHESPSARPHYLLQYGRNEQALCLEIWSLAGVLEDVQLSGGGAWLEEVGLREGWGKAGFEL